jgi:uncharacterized membrane-anchored protein YjiN (DUF445 family)
MSSPAPADRSAEDPRVTDLRRMRVIATGLLVAMTVVFAAASFAQARWEWLAYVRAFAEAGMVGACADWFAVVALFRRPLGLPIPHTAIVSNNKDRIAIALGRFLSENFLNPRDVHKQVARVDVAGMLTRWLNEPGNVEALTRQLAGQLPQIVRTLPTADLGAALGRLARRGIEGIPAAPLAARALKVLWAGGAAQAVLEQAIVLAERGLARNKSKITRIVSEQSAAWVPRWVDKMIAEKVTAGLLSTLEELRDPDHPWRLELAQAIEKLIARLADDPDTHALGERIKAEILASPLLAEQAQALWRELEHAIHAGLQNRGEPVASAITAALQALGRWLEEDAGRRKRINRTIRLLALRILLPRRAEIGGYVTEVVQSWDSTTLVERLELQVGKDLQYIRINGTLVGGLVGLLIFTASQWLAH